MMLPTPQAMAAEAGVLLAVAGETDQDSQVIQRIVALVSTRDRKMEL